MDSLHHRVIAILEATLQHLQANTNLLQGSPPPPTGLVIELITHGPHEDHFPEIVIRGFTPPE